jgi:hypothetical protein
MEAPIEKHSVIELAREPSINFYELSVGIASLHNANASLFRELPSETGMSRRRLYYLLDVGRLITGTKMTRSEAEAVGWTKLQIIERHPIYAEDLTAEEMRSILSIAKETKVRDLPKVLSGINPRQTRGVVFHLTRSQRAFLAETLTQFGAKRDHNRLLNKERALMRLVDSIWRPTPK